MGARRRGCGRVGRGGLTTAEDSTPASGDRTAARRSRVQDALLDSGRPTPEDPRIDLNALVQPNLGVIIIALSIAMLVLLAALLGLARRTNRLDTRLRNLTRGDDGRTLEAVLDAHLDKVYEVAREVDELAVRTAIVERQGRRAFQRVGLVRYNPFEETGGNQSFALALLDADGDGWVLSSLHARSGTRVYAKAVTAGAADTGLSDEESAAIQQAMTLTG